MGFGIGDNNNSSSGTSREHHTRGKLSDNKKNEQRRNENGSKKINRPVSSKSLPIYGNGNSNGNSKPSNWSDKSKQESLQKQTKLYATLARELEEKLSKRNAEIMALRRGNKVLQEECSENRSKISQLETQCVARSAKVVQLSDTIAARKSGKVQERLLEKSLQIADLVEEIQRLKNQKKHLQDNKARNGKLLLEMGEMVRMINQVDIAYNKTGNQDESNFHPNNQYPDYSFTPSEDLPQDVAMENIRRKINAMEKAVHNGMKYQRENSIQKDKLKSLRDDYQRENSIQKEKLESLRGDNADLHLQIATLEARVREQEEQAREREQQHQQAIKTSTMSPESRKSDPTSCSGTPDSEYTYRTASSYTDQTASSYSDDSSKEVSYEDFVVENGRSMSEDPSEDTLINDSDRFGESDREHLFSEVDRSLSTVAECTHDSSSHFERSGSCMSSLESPPSRCEDEEPENKNPSPKKDLTPKVVRPEEHEQLQHNFEKALDVIEKLKIDLHSCIQAPGSPGNNAPYKRDFENSSKEVARLEHELEETATHYTMLKGEHKALSDRYEEESETWKTVRANLEAKHKEKHDTFEKASKDDLEELTKRNKHLEQQYNDLETEYTLKIESLELKLKEMKHHSKRRKDDSAIRADTLEEELKECRQEMEELRAEYDAMESVQHERVDLLLKEKTKTVEEEQQKHEDLRYEYDTFLEIHLKLEEEAEQAKNHYKDSLIKIRSLESEAKDNKDAAEKVESEHKEAKENTKKLHLELIEKSMEAHKKELKTKEAEIVEWKAKHMKLKRDHVSATKAHNEATQNFINEMKQMKKDHGVVMAKQGRMRQSDAAKYQKLRRDYDASLVDYGKKEQTTIHKYEQSKQEYESKLLACEKKIKHCNKLLTVSNGNNVLPLEEKIHYVQSDSREKVEQLQTELLEVSKRLEVEAEQRFSKAQAQSRGKIDRLVKTNQKLKELSTSQQEELEKINDGQEHIKAKYDELAASYQAALLRIESIMQQKEDSTQKTADLSSVESEKVYTALKKESTRTKGGTVMDRIKQLEKNNEEQSSLPKPVLDRFNKKTGMNYTQPKPFLQNSSSQSVLDSGFERDLDMIVTKLGAHSSPTVSEVGSALSSVGSSLAGTAIFEAIKKRVEEHALIMDKMQVQKDAVTRDTIASTFEDAQIFDILRHFVQWKEVNSSFRKLSQFQTPSEDTLNSEELIAIPNEFSNIHETISDLLVHKKRFEGVQKSLLRQIIVTENDELHPSTLMELFPSEYSTTLTSVSLSDFEFAETDANPLDNIEEDPNFADENSVGTSNTSESVRKARREAARLQGENFSKQLYMNTEEIKYKTREKEMRVLDLKYQNLREEFQQMKSVEVQMPSPPSNIDVPLRDENDDGSLQPSLAMSSVTQPLMHGVKQIDCFQRKVLNAELKVECTKRECEQRKTQVLVARKEQEEVDDNLKSVMSNLKDMESFDESCNQQYVDNNILPPFDDNPSVGQSLMWELLAQPISTIGESHSVSTTSTDTQDEKATCSATKDTADESVYLTSEDEDSNNDDKGDSGDDDIDDSNEMRTNATNRIDDNPDTSFEAIQLELRKAKEAAEFARRKQLEREQNLRDVIYQYKKLQNEHNEAVAKQPQSKNQVAKELTQAKANVSAMKEELGEACERHSEEKDHLREVMGQFQVLQMDYLKVVAEKQELEKAVYHQRPGLASGFVPAANNTTGPQPRFIANSGSKIPSAGAKPTVLGRPQSSRPTPVGSPPRRVAGPPQRPKTNPAPTTPTSVGSSQRRVAGPPQSTRTNVPPTQVGSPPRQVVGPPQRPKTNPAPTTPTSVGSSQRRVASPPQCARTSLPPKTTTNNQHSKTMQLCEHDRVSPSRPIRPQGQMRLALPSKLAQTIHPTINPNRSLRTSINTHSKTMPGAQQYHQQQQQHQQQQHHKQQKIQPQQLIQKQRQDQKQKHPSQLKQPQEKHKLQATEQQQQQPSTVKPSSKRGLFRGWRRSQKQ